MTETIANRLANAGAIDILIHYYKQSKQTELISLI